MATIYFSKRDYREDMRSSTAGARAHAVCRKLTGCASQRSLWYGAHYWAACAMLGPFFKSGQDRIRERKQRIAEYRNRAMIEGEYGGGAERAGKMFDLAVQRIRPILRCARRLPSSVLW